MGPAATASALFSREQLDGPKDGITTKEVFR